MIDHVSIAVSNLERSGPFYTVVLATLGLERLVERPGTIGFGKNYPEFWINHRANLLPADTLSGAHVCLRASSPEAVAAFHEAAISAGGTSEAAPKMWPQYNDRYFAAFVTDPDGNRIEVVHFVARDG
jgi:catechol 2,3-dioxygenase-like lactoylglutathione lyase family enzyme